MSVAEDPAWASADRRHVSPRLFRIGTEIQVTSSVAIMRPPKDRRPRCRRRQSPERCASVERQDATVESLAQHPLDIRYQSVPALACRQDGRAVAQLRFADGGEEQVFQTVAGCPHRDNRVWRLAHQFGHDVCVEQHVHGRRFSRRTAARARARAAATPGPRLWLPRSASG